MPLRVLVHLNLEKLHVLGLLLINAIQVHYKVKKLSIELIRYSFYYYIKAGLMQEQAECQGWLTSPAQLALLNEIKKDIYLCEVGLQAMYYHLVVEITYKVYVAIHKSDILTKLSPVCLSIVPLV